MKRRFAILLMLAVSLAGLALIYALTEWNGTSGVPDGKNAADQAGSGGDAGGGSAGTEPDETPEELPAEPEPEPAVPGEPGQLPALGTGREHRLGARVDGDSGHLGGVQLAADALGALQHGDPDPVTRVPSEVPRGGEPCDAPAYDRDVRPSGPLRAVPGPALATRSSCHTTDVTVTSHRYGPLPRPRR